MISLQKLRKIATSREREEGLTILELLVVVTIIAIITAIAIPVFSVQRKKAADSSVRSDMQSVAQTFYAWQASGNKSNADFHAMAGNRTAVIAKHPESPALEGVMSRWNDVSGFPVEVSRANSVEIVVRADPAREGTFCLAGTGANSQWNYIPGSGMHMEYNKMLFFDSAAGGIKTMEDLMGLHSQGQTLACREYVTAYIASGAI